MPNPPEPTHQPDWKVGDPVAITKDHHPPRKGVITRVMSLHVMVSCDSLHGRLIKFAKKTGRKVAPYAQTSTWIRPWTSRDQELEEEVHKLMHDTSTTSKE